MRPFQRNLSSISAVLRRTRRARPPLSRANLHPSDSTLHVCVALRGATTSTRGPMPGEITPNEKARIRIMMTEMNGKLSARGRLRGWLIAAALWLALPLGAAAQEIAPEQCQDPPCPPDRILVTGIINNCAGQPLPGVRVVNRVAAPHHQIPADGQIKPFCCGQLHRHAEPSAPKFQHSEPGVTAKNPLTLHATRATTGRISTATARRMSPTSTVGAGCGTPSTARTDRRSFLASV